MKKFFNQMTQTELPQTEEPRSEHGIANGLGNKFVVLAKQAQIVIRPVHDQLVT